MLYPFDLPADVHPDSWLLLGFGLMPEQIAVLSKHLFDDMGLRLVKDTSERVFSWAVGLDVEGRERVEVGDEVDVLVASNGAVRLTDGALPPGVRLVIQVPCRWCLMVIYRTVLATRLLSTC